MSWLQGMGTIKKQQRRLRWMASVMLGVFLINTVFPAGVQVCAQPVMPQTGLSRVSSVPLLKGLRIYPNDPLHLDFVLEKGNTALADARLRTDASRLVKYFLAALTVPEKDLWVNLSPYEQDRIVPEAFGQTEMGRALLSQDYMLKQLSASLLHPDAELGKKFWQRVYVLAGEKFGSTVIPQEAFHKIWIVPDTVEIAVRGTVAYIRNAHMKVMTETDYLATKKAETSTGNQDDGITAQVLKEVVVPAMEKEVNESAAFAPLRQVYYSLVLAVWLKRKFRILDNYVDQNKTTGVDSGEKDAAHRIWNQYVASFRKGVVNMVREEEDPMTREILPRRYFSGGFDASAIACNETLLNKDFAAESSSQNRLVEVQIRPVTEGVKEINNGGIFKIQPAILQEYESGKRSDLLIGVSPDGNTAIEGESGDGDKDKKNQMAVYLLRKYHILEPICFSRGFHVTLADGKSARIRRVIVSSDSGRTKRSPLAISPDGSVLYLHWYALDRLVENEPEYNWGSNAWADILQFLVMYHQGFLEDEFLARQWLMAVLAGDTDTTRSSWLFGDFVHYQEERNAHPGKDRLPPFGLILDRDILQWALLSPWGAFIPYEARQDRTLLAKMSRLDSDGVLEKKVRPFYEGLWGERFSNYWPAARQILTHIIESRNSHWDYIGDFNRYAIEYVPSTVRQIEVRGLRSFWERIVKAELWIQENTKEERDLLFSVGHAGSAEEILLLLKKAEEKMSRSGTRSADDAYRTWVRRNVGKDDTKDHEAFENILYPIGDPVPGPWKKAEGFEILKRHGIRFPPGVTMGLSAARISPLQSARDIIDYFRNHYPDARRVAVRSAPEISLPGLMETVLDVPLEEMALAKAIGEVMESWYDPDVRAALADAEARRVSDGYPAVDFDLGIMFQQMVYGNKKDGQSCAGVIFSHDPVTGDEAWAQGSSVKLFGNVSWEAPGESIVSGAEAGDNISSLAKSVPAIYQALAEVTVQLAVDFRGPVEIEFAVESGTIYILQVRPEKLGRAGLLKYLSTIDPLQALPYLEELQRLEKARPLYGLKPGVIPREIGSGIGIGGGVAVGQLSFSGEGENRIVVLSKENRDALYTRLKHEAGFLTDFGGPSSHVAVLGRAAGLPGVMGAGHLQIDLDKKEVVFENGLVLEEGDWIGLDADTGRIFLIPGAMPNRYVESLQALGLVHDKTFGVDLQKMRKEVRHHFAVMRRGRSPQEAARRLLLINVTLQLLYERASQSNERRALWLNARKHFVHELFLEMTDGDPEGTLAVALAVARGKSGQGLAETAAAVNFVTLLTSLANDSRDLKDFQEIVQFGVKMYQEAPDRLDAVKELVRHFQDITMRSNPFTYAWRNKSLIPQLRVYRFILRAIYRRLLAEPGLAETERGMKILESLGSSLGKHSSDIQADIAFFKKYSGSEERGKYIREQDAFVSFHLIDAGDHLKDLETLVTLRKRGMLIEWFPERKGDNHRGFWMRYAPVASLPAGLAEEASVAIEQRLKSPYRSSNAIIETVPYDTRRDLVSALGEKGFQALCRDLDEDAPREKGGIDFNGKRLTIHESGAPFAGPFSHPGKPFAGSIIGYEPEIINIRAMSESSAFGNI